ncbi:MAG: hypothetical protein OQK82_08675, partial [Candidatus Pacearchaeota archaeon]|nr:hypothetical protein [Candidatus Pacearchaeota archaeon]
MVIKNILIIFAALMFISSNLLAISNPGHSADEIIIEIKGYTLTLQEAVDNYFIQNSELQPIKNNTNISPVSHHGKDINIYLNEIVNLQDAIDNSLDFCKNNIPSFNWNQLFFGHNSDKIEITINGTQTTLQEAINTGKLCPPYTYDWSELGDWTACSVTCGGGTQTQTIICERSDGTQVEEENCDLDSKPSNSQECNTQICPTCSDGIQNQGETGIDTGGPCPPWPRQITSGGYTFTCDGLWHHIFSTRWACDFPKVYS